MASGKLQLEKSTRMMSGRYSDLHHSIELQLEPTGEKLPEPGGNEPSHNVYISIRGGKGDPSLAGAAWVKRIEKDGASKGRLFYSIQIDDPSFSTTLNLTAFPVQDNTGKVIDGEFEIVWRRPRSLAA